jgi:hypothetical protein
MVLIVQHLQGNKAEIPRVEFVSSSCLPCHNRLWAEVRDCTEHLANSLQIGNVCRSATVFQYPQLS